MIVLSPYSLSRSLICIGTLITLVFNDVSTLFGNKINNNSDFFHIKYNFFSLFGENLVFGKVLAIIILLIVIIGYYPRFTGLLHFYITYSFFLACDVVDGGDHIASNLTLLLCPLCLLDGRKNQWSRESSFLIGNNTFDSIIKRTFVLLICIQVCSIYLHAFVGKLFVEEWINGTAVYYWFTHSYFGVNPFFLDPVRQVLSNDIIVLSITWGTLIFEFLLAACLILPKNDHKRILFLILGICFHLAIVFIHGLVSFYFVMAAALVLYLIPFDLQVSLNEINKENGIKLFKKLF